MTDHLEPDRAAREALTRLVAGYLDEWFDRAAGMDASAEDIDHPTLDRLRQPPSETGRSMEEILAESIA